MEVIRVHDFDLNNLVEGPAIVLNAKRGSGKSLCIRHLIYHFGTVLKYKVGVICSKSEDVDRFYSDFFPESYIYKDCIKTLEKVLMRQKKLILNNIQRKKEGKELIDERILVVLDDVISDSKIWGKSEILKEIMNNGRHYKIAFILAVQDTVAIPPGIRVNFDYIFLFRNDNANELQKIHQYYAGMFSTLKIFKEVANATTENYGVLILIFRGVNSGKLEDKIARFKADPNIIEGKNYMFGSDKFKQIHKKRYNKNWQIDELKFSLQTGNHTTNIKFDTNKNK